MHPTAPMAIECAHCGTRCEAGATRCPRCLRTTHLVEIPDAPPKAAVTQRRGALAAGLALGALLASGGIFLAVRAHPEEPPRAPLSAAPRESLAPLRTGPALASLTARLAAERDPLARARLAAEAVQRQRSGASVAGEGDPIPPPRDLDALWSALAVSGERVTSLDLARLTAGLLLAANTPAAVACRTAPSRPDEPSDPTGLAGSFTVIVGEHAVDAASGQVLSATLFPHERLDARALSAAVAAQAALSSLEQPTGRQRALEYANAAVSDWPASPVPLAVRARVWLALGGTSGHDLADTDLRAAIALRDEAPYHVARARVLLRGGDTVGAAREAARALRLASAWGTGALSVVAFGDVLTRLDAGAPSGCAGLRASRATWTDDAYALCAGETSPSVRAEAAARMMQGPADPLRLAYAAAHGASGLSQRVREGDRREAALWLSLLGHPELARGLLTPGDGGT